MADIESGFGMGDADSAGDTSMRVSASAEHQRVTADGQPQDFYYEPLEAGRIRLLRISAQTEHQIECQLIEVDLSSPGQYWALSYVCGKSDADQDILLDNQ